MPRPGTGTIVEKRNAAGEVTRMLRVSLGDGRKRALSLGVVTQPEAEAQLRHALADIEQGRPWPPRHDTSALADVPSFHAHAEQWWIVTERQLSENTQADYKWRLEKHLIPYFGELPLDAIKAADIERYIAAKLAGDSFERGRKVGQGKPLSARSINMTVTLLGAILDTAVRHELIARNAARGCRARERAPTRSYLETAGQIRALLDAAGELDTNAPKDRRHVARRAMIATLTFAGLRIGELCALRWRDVDLAAGWLTVQAAKTDAGRRRVKLRGALRDELATLRACAGDGKGLVFPTRTGSPMGAENFRNRVLAAAIKRANENLEADGLPPLPDKLTPHSLRRTFCSLLYALGETPPVVMQEMGHTDPALALKVYAQAMRRGEDETAQLRALVDGGGFGHRLDTNADLDTAGQLRADAA